MKPVIVGNKSDERETPKINFEILSTIRKIFSGHFFA